MNKAPFDTNLDKLINVWCQWCVDHKSWVSLQDWMGYTHNIAVAHLILAVYKEKPARRIDMRALLADPVKRKALMVDCIIATQAREGIETTREQAEAAYENVQAEIRASRTASDPRTSSGPARSRGAARRHR